MLLGTHSMDTLANVEDVASGHYLVDGRTALLATLPRGSHYAWPKLERKGIVFLN